MQRRKPRRITPILVPVVNTVLALLTLSVSPATAHGATRWRAELLPPNGSIGPRGTVVIEPSRVPNHTRVRVVISGDKPGAKRPWHVHAGQCGEQAPIVGPEDVYARIRINGRGNGVAVIDLPVPFPQSGELFVSVHESAKAMESIVISGQLTH
jgi:superoxide dismutase, Cu-Zn family